MMTIQKYVRAKTLEEAYELNQSRQNRIIGGMLWLKMSSLRIHTAIDLCDLGLDTIEETDEAFSIGAMVTLRQLEQHPGLNRYASDTPARAVRDIVGVQFRNMATVGGSLWGRFGFSDVLTVFLAMDSYVELYKGGIIPLKDFAAMKPDSDLLVRLIVKKTPMAAAYQAMRIQRTDLPVLTCAVTRLDGRWQAAIGARPHRAVIIADEEGLLSGGATPEAAEAFAAYAAARTPVGGNMRGSAAYRSHLIKALVSRCIMELGGER